MARSGTLRLTLGEARPLGAGGMAEVQLAQAETEQGLRWVALKRIRADLRGHRELREQFQREARIGALLHHPHVVTLLDWAEDAQGPYLVLEYVFGRSASELLSALTGRGQRLPVELALLVARDVADALGYTHRGVSEGGVVHRDVSPDNVLVGFDGVAKLSDFGVARLEGATALTRSSTVKGKFGYIAPEVFEGHDVSAATDVFAFGATLYYLVAGVRPFQGKTEAELMRAVLTAQPVPLRRHSAEVPEAIERLVQGCLERSPAARPTMAHCQSLLEAHLVPPLEARRRTLAELMARTFPAAEDPRSLPLPPPTTRLVRPRRGKRARWVVAGVAACLVGVAGVTLSRGLPAVGGSPSAVGGSPSAVGGSPSAVGGSPSAVPGSPSAVGGSPSAVGGSPSAVPGSAEAVALGGGAVDVAAEPEEHRPPGKTATPGGARRAKPKVKPKALGATGERARGDEKATVETGWLSVRVHPWAQVFVDGEPVGTTPVTVALSAGQHSVILVQPTRGERRSYAVDITGGKSSELKVVLDGPTTSGP